MNTHLIFEKTLGDGSHFQMQRLETSQFEVVAGICITGIKMPSLGTYEWLDCRTWQFRWEWLLEEWTEPAWGFAAITASTLVSVCGHGVDMFYISALPIPESALIRWADALRVSGLARLELHVRDANDQNERHFALPIVSHNVLVHGERAEPMMLETLTRHSRRN